MKTQTRKRLEDFIKRAEKIQNYSYLNNKKNIVGFEIISKTQVIFHQPEEEQTDALLLNLRLFYGASDDISIRGLEKLCDDPGISERWKSEYKAIREDINGRFNMIAVERNNETITYRDIFEMFLFGSIGHQAEKDKASKLYKKWIPNDNVWEIMNNKFHETIVWLLVAIINISKSSKEEIQRDNKLIT